VYLTTSLDKSLEGNVIHQSADIDVTASIAESATIWHLAQIREGAQSAGGVTIGRGAYLGPAVRVGANSKIQNFALIYEPADLGVGVFIGPGAVLTNDQRPRAVNPDASLKTSQDWEQVGVTVLDGASIGARAVCVAPVTIGRWSMVAAGAVVIDHVPDFALVVGVPARRVGWVGRHGSRLERVPGSAELWVCPVTLLNYQETVEGTLIELSGSGSDV
jgi:acetyltransferase-like isoleucine patch superfamily enzyme